MRHILIIIMLLLLVGCKTRYITTTNTIREEVRDTIVRMDKDSTMFEALLRCDSLGNVLMDELAIQQGRNSKVKYLLLGNKIRIKSLVEPSDIKLQYRNTYTSTQQIETIYKDKPLRWWQRGLMSLGIFMIIIFFLKIYKLFRGMVC